MNPFLQAKMTAGIRKIQGLWSELIVIGAVPVTALLGPESLGQKFTPTGMTEVIRMPASIAQPDLASAPVIGRRVTARGKAWRIETVTPTQTTWELVLETPNK